MTASLRFAAKLLFQFRIGPAAASKFRTCEERTVILHATSVPDAYAKAGRLGKQAQTDCLNSDGTKVFFEYVGLVDLLELGLECEDNEVWYEIRTMLSPMERRHRLVKPLSALNKSAIARSGATRLGGKCDG